MIALAPINDQLALEEPSEMFLRGVSEYGRSLRLSFVCHGGPREDEEFEVTFDESVVFHLPAVLSVPVRFRLGALAEARATVPSISFDESEIGPEGYGLVLLTDPNGIPHGYYVLAGSVHARWVPADSI